MTYLAIATTIYLLCAIWMFVALRRIRRDDYYLPWSGDDWFVAVALVVLGPIGLGMWWMEGL